MMKRTSGANFTMNTTIHHPMPGNRRLRERLEQMTRSTDVIAHPKALQELKRDHPHGIRVHPSPNDEPLGRYNCVMYALGLVGRMREPLRIWSFRVDLDFLYRLTDEGYLTASTEPKSGSLVIWSSAHGVKHVGILASPERAISKWGIGLLLEHALHEVPASYGDHLTYYDPPDSKTQALIYQAISDD